MIFNSSLIIGLSLTSTTNSPLLVISTRYASTTISFHNLNFKRFSSYAFFDKSLSSLTIFYSRFAHFLNTPVMISKEECSIIQSETIYDRYIIKCMNATQCTFLKVQSNSTGGAICIKWSEKTYAFIDRCTFVYCTARSEGGAIYFGIYPVQFGILSATSSIFSNCLIDNIYDFNEVNGGAIFCHCEIINVSNSTFRNCEIRSSVGNCRGGAIYADVCNAEKAFYLTVFLYCFVSRLPPPPTSTPTESATPSFTPSDKFTASLAFTLSNSFTSSNHFTRSNTFSNSFFFTSSKAFSKSIQFTKSSLFTKTEKFTKSSQFTMSSQFLPSSTFSGSKQFSPSNCFSKSSAFTRTEKFSSSKVFTKSIAFTKSQIFDKSSEFTKSVPFSKSSPFTKTLPFTQTSHFTASLKFSKTKEFTKSILFSKSNAFSKSDCFSKSDAFTLSMTFTPYPTVTATPMPTESPTESIPPESTIVPQSTVPPQSTKPLPTNQLQVYPPTSDPPASYPAPAQLLSYHDDDEDLSNHGFQFFNDLVRLVSASEGGAVYLKLSENVHRTVDLYGTNFTGCSGSHGAALFAPDRIDLVLNSTRFIDQVTEGQNLTYSTICMDSDTNRNNSLYVESVGISNVDSFNLITSTSNQLTFLNNPFETGDPFDAGDAFVEKVDPTIEWFSKPPIPAGSINFHLYNQMPYITSPPVSDPSRSPSLSPTIIRTPTTRPPTPPTVPSLTSSSDVVFVTPTLQQPTASNSVSNADSTSGEKKSKLSPVAIFFIVLACLALVIGVVWAVCLYGFNNFNCRRKKAIQPDYHWREIEYF